ncbi:UNVERIFIED_CONTAM: hypothetical protein K2H54_073875 [Gekko kuhli]
MEIVRGVPSRPAGRCSPAPPPPPPPAPTAACRCKLRNFNWEALPAQRVRGRRNLWTTGGRAGGFGLDLRLLDELFGQRSRAAAGGLRGHPAEQLERTGLFSCLCVVRGTNKLCSSSENQNSGQFSKSQSESLKESSRESPPPKWASSASLLDAKKILNLGIFLKQFKRPAQAIVADIRDGAGALYGAEKLLELAKMLPDGEEVKRLEAFQGSQSRLSEAEVFTLLLVRVPSYTRRLELLVLKEEFFPRLNALQSAVQTMTEAATELLNCEELHCLILLVLEAGNYMNEVPCPPPSGPARGGYAGSALGFRMSSLLRLADTKANRPGMDLLHFVALEAARKDPRLLFFPRKLPHVGPASRILGQEVVGELQSLGQRLEGAREGPEALDLKGQMEPFLRVAEAELGVVRALLDGLREATDALCDFFCEEPETFSLAECCRVFQAFGERFLAAAQENEAREAAERHRRQRQEQARQEKKKRRSIATCSARDPDLLGVELDLLFLGAPRSGGQHSGTLQGPSPLPPLEGPLPLCRRHTLTTPSPRCHPEPLMPPALFEPGAPSAAKRAGLFGQGLRALLTSPPARPTPEPHASSSSSSPGAPQSFRFSSLFQKKRPPGGAETPPTSPQGSPREGAGLLGFFRRLSSGEKAPPPSQA